MSVVKARVQLWAGILLFVGGVSYPIAYAAWHFMQVSFALALGASALVLLIGVLAIFSYFRNRDEETGRIMTEPQLMNIEEAAQAAQAILSDSTRFAVVRRRAVDYPHASDLANHLGKFLDDIESLRAVRGDAQILDHQFPRPH
jgi:hypothetical protein